MLGYYVIWYSEIFSSTASSTRLSGRMKGLEWFQSEVEYQEKYSPFPTLHIFAFELIANTPPGI